jgi:hypothetical protein
VAAVVHLVVEGTSQAGEQGIDLVVGLELDHASCGRIFVAALDGVLQPSALYC